MSDVQSAMALLIGAFHRYAGNEKTLNRAKLRELLESEFGDMLGKANDQATVDEIFKGLDQDGSDTVDFTEFCTMVAALTAATNEMLSEQR